MESRAAWSAESREAFAAVAASAAALAAFTGSGAERTDPPGADALRDADPLRDLADGCLDGLAEVARLEARTAALKVQLAADYARAARFLAPPAASPQEHTAQEMAVVAEVACVLTVSERTAAALLSDSRVLTTGLPLTLAALRAGTISWQHARILVEETAGLDPAGAAGLEAHFLDPDAANPARGCPAGDLVPSRFRAKARAWRERHHPVSIEKRHTTSAADRRVEFVPDRDGMAWLSAHLPADTAAGIWARTTAAARALQGPEEARTLGPAPRRHHRHLAPHQRNPRRRDRPVGRHGGGPADGGHRPGRGRVRGCAVAAGAGPGHRPGPVAAGRHRRTGRPGRVRADPAVHGPPPDRRRRRLLPPRPDRPPRRRPAGNRPDQLPCHEGPASLAPAPRRQVSVSRLRQPLAGQRGRPPPGLGRRRHHRHLQPGPAVPQAPPAETRLRLETNRGQQGPPAGLDLPVRTALPERGAGLGTAPLAGPPPGHGHGHGPDKELDHGLPADPGHHPDPALTGYLGLRNPAGITNRTCPRTPSRTGTNSWPRIHCSRRTRTIRGGRRPSTTPSPECLLLLCV